MILISCHNNKVLYIKKQALGDGGEEEVPFKRKTLLAEPMKTTMNKTQGETQSTRENRCNLMTLQLKHPWGVRGE